jgi:protein-tyrosine phosphatase
LTRERVLVWDGCVNVRDLGGLPLEGGGETCFGVLVRADSIAGLTEAGWAALANYGVALAVDLRGEHERAELDRRREPPIPVLRIPISPNTGPALLWPSMLEAYLGILEDFRRQFAEVVDAIADMAAPVVIHCHGGRDRTGLTAALLLRLAGVDAETIAADHALSDESWAPYNVRWFEEAPDGAERARRQRVAAPAGRTMAEVLAEVDLRYGGVRAYLRDASPQNIDRIVVRLRGDSTDSE